MRDAVICAAVRTPVGKRGGGLSGVHAVDLSAHVLNALVERARIEPALVEDVFWGCVSQVGEQTFNIGRNAPLAAGWPETVTGTTIDRQCGSSQQAVAFAAATVISGQADVIVAGGVESMSRVPMGSTYGVEGTGTPMGPTFLARYGGVFPNQGVGAVSMMTGSAPAITVVCTRTIGRRPSSRAFSLVVTSRAADPSEIWLALPALMTPSSLNGVFSEASENSSSCVREKPHCSAIISAPTPWLGNTPP